MTLVNLNVFKQKICSLMCHNLIIFSINEKTVLVSQYQKILKNSSYFSEAQVDIVIVIDSAN